MRDFVQSVAMLLALAVSSPALSSSRDLPRPNGKNCDLRSPPKAAHRSATHGLTFATHPRVLPVGYTGCKLMWIAESNYLLSIAYFKAGVLQFGHAREPKEQPYSCCYSSEGALLTNKSSPSCPAAEEWR